MSSINYGATARVETGSHDEWFDTDILADSQSSEAADLECPVCLRLMSQPMLHATEKCGRHFCKTCVNQLADGNKRCPWCRDPLSNLVPDASASRRLGRLRVKCLNAKQGCSWTGEFGVEGKNAAQHLQTCERVLLACPSPGCSERVVRCRLADHLVACPRRLIACDDCKQQVAASSMGEHLQMCPESLLDCPNQCLSANGMILRVRRSRLPAHSQSECANRTVPCSFHKFGCQHRALFTQMTAHEQHPAALASHLSLVLQRVGGLESRTQLLEQQIAELKNPRSALPTIAGPAGAHPIPVTRRSLVSALLVCVLPRLKSAWSLVCSRLMEAPSPACSASSQDLGSVKYPASSSVKDAWCFPIRAGIRWRSTVRLATSISPASPTSAPRRDWL